MKETKEKKIIPFRKAAAIFVWWTMLLSIGGYFLYMRVLKPYIVDKPTIIKVEKPQEDKK
ncbi:MAG: hypothetical protein AAB632_01845 [Patescibacteria group bacterium]